jgi:hypothetical protein
MVVLSNLGKKYCLKTVNLTLLVTPIKIIILFNVFNFPENQAGYLCPLIFPEGTAESRAYVTATFNLSTAASTDVSLYSEDQS